MGTLKRVVKILLRTLGTLIGVVLLYLAAEFVLASIAVGREAGTKSDVEIYIQTNGVHTDIVMPLRTAWMDWSKEMKFSDTQGKDTTARYVGVGWGDKGFYMAIPTWADLTFPVAFNAAFGLDGTALHATFYRSVHEGVDCRKISISGEQYARLVAYVLQSAQTDAEGHFIPIVTDANYGQDDAFYEAKGRYHFYYSCNTWANDALKACGQRHCVWTIFKRGIFAKYPLDGKDKLQ